MNTTHAAAGTLMLFALATMIFGPLASIAALNVLFGLGLAYNFTNYLAALWLTIILGGTRASAS